MRPPLREKEASMRFERTQEAVDAGLEVEGAVGLKGGDGWIRGHVADQERRVARSTRLVCDSCCPKLM